MISIQRVSKSYDGTKKAVDQLSLEIRDGEIFGLLGPNGAGKSTLLKMLVGILRPDEGALLLNGKSIQQSPVEAKREFCYVADDPDRLLRLKGHEFLRFMADIYELPEELRSPRIERLVADFGMSAELGNQLQSYSHGMRQKMMVIAALLVSPNIWILDEPMTGLDPKAAFLLKQKMREHADQGKIVLFSTHVLDVAEKVVDRVGVIDKGKLIFVGTVEELRSHFKNNSSLEEMFLEMTGETSPLADSAE